MEDWKKALSVRAQNVLHFAGLTTREQVLDIGLDGIKQLNRCGKILANEIFDAALGRPPWHVNCRTTLSALPDTDPEQDLIAALDEAMSWDWLESDPACIGGVRRLRHAYERWRATR